MGLLATRGFTTFFVLGIMASSALTAQDVVTETVASGLDHPWALAFAPDGRLFVTESLGRLRVIDASGLRPDPVIDLTAITPDVEGGLMGIAVDPDFAANRYLYVAHTVLDGSGLRNRVLRLIERDNHAVIDRVLLDNIDAAERHNGGRVKLGPDGRLYITIGDGSFERDGDPYSAQDLNSLHGKVIRMNLDGSPPIDNPFPLAPYVYTYGHRNPQGIAFDVSGQLYETEHGPVSNDEVNIMFSGGNYGWPICVGICGDPNFMDPIRLYFPETNPPSGATFYYGSALPWDGSLFFTTLGTDNPLGVGENLHRILFDQPGGTQIVEEEALFQGQFGRIRDVIEGPDEFLYFCTDNNGSGLGSVNDQVVRVRPR